MAPLLVAVCLSLFGCSILAACVYHTLAFGNGDTETGNFNRYVYITKVDPVTKAIDRSWFEVATTERTSFGFVNMWVVGAIFLVGGPAVWALEYAFRDNRHF